MSEEDVSKLRTRPIVKLGILLISYSTFFCVVSCVAGVVALLLLPVLAKNTYISENALMPGSGNSMIAGEDVSEADKLVNDISALVMRPGGAGFEIQRTLALYISKLGAEVTYQKFYPQMDQFDPLHFFTSPGSGTNLDSNITCSLYGVNTVGIVRAPRGDGKEAIVLVTPYNSVNLSRGEVLSLGTVYSVVSLLSRVTWLAKDVVWLAADSKYGEYAAVAAWLRGYLAPTFIEVAPEKAGICNVSSNFFETKDDHYSQYGEFRRAGTMAAALVIKVAEQSEIFEDTLTIYPEASNGQMPNLDLINIVNYLAVHRQGLRIKVKKMLSLLKSRWLKSIGETFEILGQVARNLNPEWKFGVAAAEYIEGMATLASSLYHQGLGIPSGPHGAFRDFQVDAITLEISPRISPTKMVRRSEFLLRFGRLIEGVVRSVNNLLEKFHQSFFLYLLISPSKFVSVGVYMIPFALLIAPLPIVAASLHTGFKFLKGKSPPPAQSTSEVGMSHRSLKWMNSAKKVFIFHLWGAVVSLLPYFVSQIPNSNATFNFFSWLTLSLFSFLIVYIMFGSSYASSSQPQTGEWASLKSMTILAAFIGLCLMSVVNFATAELGALFLVPMCLFTQPLMLDLKVGRFSAFMRAACNLCLVVIVFPPATYFIVRGAFEDFKDINVGDFWSWAESLWAWNSATYLYICMVHLPCWALCINIVFYRF